LRLKLPKPQKPPQIVEVEWIDAAVYTGDMPQSGMATMKTVGYFFAADRKLVWLASDYDESDHEFRTKHVIPRVHIVRMTILAAEKNIGPS
jgi:hypothetical protein